VGTDDHADEDLADDGWLSEAEANLPGDLCAEEEEKEVEQELGAPGEGPGFA